MKKIFSIIAAVLFAGSMMADVVTFTKDDFAGQGTANTGSQVTATKGGVTFSYSKGYCADESLRCYAHGSLSITASATIVKISFKTTGGKDGGLPSEVDVNATSYSVADLASQARLTEIKVTLDGEGGGEGEGEGGEGGGGEQELTDPTNCAEAREAALSVSGNNELYNGGKEYTIEGYVTSIASAFNPTYSNVSFWMADTEDGGQVLEAYRAACASAADAPSVGDKVAVTGKLTKYGNTPEFAAGCTFTILEHGQVEPAKNLGEKSIEEFLSLKNEKDTCILTGVVKNIVMDKDDPSKPNKYGNFDLVDEENEEISVYIYGLLTATGESQQFVQMGINEDDIIKIKAIYSEYNGKPQVKNAILVEHTPGGSQTAIDNTAVEVKAQKVVRDGQLFIIRNGVVFNANGTTVK